MQDERTRRLVEEAEVQEGCRAVGFTLGVPGPSEVGVVDDVLVDRAFVEQRRTAAAELATLDDLRGDGPPRHRTSSPTPSPPRRWPGRTGCRPARCGTGCGPSCPSRTASPRSATVDGVRWVDDSKATNPHAARVSLAAYEHVVWVAGGLLKGADVDDLVAGAADRLRGVVLIGRDRAGSREALARHAPDVPVVDVDRTDTGAMDLVVREARALAREGDVVLLAPAAASMDMFADYGARGDAFVAAVSRLAAGE